MNHPHMQAALSNYRPLLEALAMPAPEIAQKLREASHDREE